MTWWPPVLAIAQSWEPALLDVITSTYAGVPLCARAVFMMGAPVTVTACPAGRCTGCATGTA
ncbi:hypothetical protein ACIBL8_06725 [Streptomyces sp. NPDC050523]|uniref:hypothetical protein n=1 Tax=Streptomyces sp. NPDC050523 TaxID=3365622 RepID=UPI003791720C